MKITKNTSEDDKVKKSTLKSIQHKLKYFSSVSKTVLQTEEFKFFRIN